MKNPNYLKNAWWTGPIRFERLHWCRLDWLLPAQALKAMMMKTMLLKAIMLKAMLLTALVLTALVPMMPLCAQGTAPSLLFRSPHLEIEQVRPGVYLHRSYLSTQQWGKVGCNGMIYLHNREAIVFDSPVGDTATRELLLFLRKKQRAVVKAIVVNHFHNDCLDQLQLFHQSGISSYSSERTRELAAKQKLTVPQNGFEEKLVLQLGERTVENRYFGEAHSKDNIVSYLPEEKALFGGCMIKELGASQGHLGDANLNQWSATVQKVKSAYPELRYVIPGHGKAGDASLLDYTIGLFMPGGGKAPADTGHQDLYRTISRQDSLMFDAFNRQDLEALMAFFDESLEFYHDKGGLSGYAQTRNGFRRLFEQNKTTGLHRMSMPGSMEVYPIPGTGAVSVNLHRFCHMENGKNDCGVFRNMMVWKKTGEQWKVIRVISYDH